jgi:membrane protein implicated in regulation of membrane protease activity
VLLLMALMLMLLLLLLLMLLLLMMRRVIRGLEGTVVGVLVTGAVDGELDRMTALVVGVVVVVCARPRRAATVERRRSRDGIMAAGARISVRERRRHG